MYKFHLGAVLNHRKYIEENIQKELSILKQILIDERNKLNDMMHAKDRFSGDLQTKQKKIITASESLLYVRFLERLSLNLNEQKERVIKAENNVEEKRKALIEAMKRRKALEKLKEKGLQSYNRGILKKEQNFMNEMASSRHIIKQ